MKKMNKFMKVFVTIVLAVAAIFSCVSCKKETQEAPVEMKYFIENAATDYDVVVSSRATETELFAAEEFINFTQQVTGVQLELKTDNQVSFSETEKVVCIGNTRLLKFTDYEVDKTALNTDGFIIKNFGEMIFICGAVDRGTLYGVYEFLERYLGVKFLTFDTTYVPQKSDVQVEKTLNITEVPDFEIRDYYSQTTKDPLFAARMRMESVVGGAERYGGSFMDLFYDWQFHNTISYVKSSPVWQEHDEWFTTDGKMVCYTNGITDADKLDESVEESAVKAVIEKLKQNILDSAPSEKYFMIGQEDLVAPCTCSRCQASALRNTKTGTMIVWMNVICEAIEEWAKVTVPEKEYYICCFAYSWSQSAPVKVDPTTQKYVAVNENVVPHEDLYVMYAPITICYYHTINDTSCSMNDQGRAQISGWGAITNRMLIWDYSCNYRNFLWYFPNTSVLKENLQLYKDTGVIYVRTQGPAFDKNSYQQQLLNYLLSKLMWNIDRDVYDLIHEFNKYYFAEGAEYMNEYIDLFERHFAMLNIHTELYENTPTFVAAETYPLEMLEKAIDLTNQGYAMVEASNRTEEEKEAFKKRFTRARIQAEYMILKNIDAYGYGTAQKTQFIANFFQTTDALGITHFAENISASQLKEKYGY